jgi:hypothetical protein
VSRRGALVALAFTIIAFAVWRAELFTVARPGDHPRALAVIDEAVRHAVDFDLALPAVPAGIERVSAGGRVLLVHYWAPWERHSLAQASTLDSLRRDPALGQLRVVLVCFDPFPSVARYVGRNRLRLPVLLDGRRDLAARLPCPSIPYTYVVDEAGRIAVAQPGEVEWLSPATRGALESLLGGGQRPAPRPDGTATSRAT